METLEEGAESGFHWMRQTNILSGMMELGGSSSSSGACSRDLASALMFLGPG